MITERSSRNIIAEYRPYFDKYGFVQLPKPGEKVLMTFNTQTNTL
jgi:hypothetical protein